LGVAAASAIVAGAAACGNASATGSPSHELRSALTDLGHTQTLTATLKLDATADQLRRLAKASGDQLPPRVANLASGARAAFEVKAPDGKTISDLRGHGGATGKVRLALTVDGDKIVQARSLAKTLYLRADVDKIAQLAHAQDDLAKLRHQIPRGYDWAQAGLAGKWVSVDEKAVKDLAGGAFPSPSPSASANLLRQLRAVLAKDVTVRRAGQTSGGFVHLVLTGNIRTIGRDLLVKIRKLTPGAANFPIRASNLPNKKVHLDAFVDDGTLHAVSLDLAQFGGANTAGMKGKSIPLRIDFAESGASIEQPASATPVNLTQLTPLFSKLMQSSGPASISGGSASSTSASAGGSGFSGIELGPSQSAGSASTPAATAQ
jgi:hypothetical protein